MTASDKNVEATSSAVAPSPDKRFDFRRFHQQIKPLVPFLSIILITLIFIIAAPDRVVTAYNIRTILNQFAVTAIVAFGMTFAMVSGAIDLSVGSAMALSAMVAARTMKTHGVVVGLGLGLLVGTAVGLFNGVTITALRIPSFITTMGTLLIIQAAEIMYSQGSASMISNEFALDLGRFPYLLFVVIGAFVVCTILFSYTRFGRYTQAIGGDERVAQLTGVPIRSTKVKVFTLCGLLSGLAGLMLACRCGAAATTMAYGYELNVILAVAVGGTPLSGGVGKVYNAIIGALTVAILANGLNIVGASSEMQEVIKGFVLILAVAISLDRDKIGTIK